MSPASPSSSPRLPSPPPFTEVQMTPISPGMNATQAASTIDADDITKLEQGAERRIRPGTKSADMASGPPLRPLTEVSVQSMVLIQQKCPRPSWLTDSIGRLCISTPRASEISFLLSYTIARLRAYHDPTYTRNSPRYRKSSQWCRPLPLAL